jgi:type II secretory ATPase GspE/PulE/Tfp pilus assembly ATPase PilB-like protein
MEGWVEHEAEDRLVNMRVSCVPSVSGDKLSLRILDPRRMQSSLGDLGFSSEQSELIHEWIEDIQGMFLVAGAVGTGKTSTLYSLLDELKGRECSIVTVEDPVEYRIDGITQMQLSEKKELDFAESLKTILRIDPDYIMLGEMRDEASIETAWDAASTGKVLLSTLHSKDAAGVISSLRNYGREDFEIASFLEMVVAQRLVRTLCDECKEAGEPEAIDRKWFESFDCELPDSVNYAKGCEACGGVGYKGRSGLFEVWRVDNEHKEFILSHPDELSLRGKLREWGIPSLMDSAMQMISDGQTSPYEIRTIGGFSK